MGSVWGVWGGVPGVLPFLPILMGTSEKMGSLYLKGDDPIGDTPSFHEKTMIMGELVLKLITVTDFPHRWYW